MYQITKPSKTKLIGFALEPPPTIEHLFISTSEIQDNFNDRTF